MGFSSPQQKSGTTPHDLHIQSRNRHFASLHAPSRLWNGGDPYATAFYNALSITFPRGERFFMEVLRRYRDDVPEKLSREIRVFCQQEAVHSREHACFNAHLENDGYDISRLEAAINGVMDRVAGMSKERQLVATVCLEHLTAIMAAEFISNSVHFDNADEQQRNLWLWHASEEIEHKGVAYDTWLEFTKDWSRWKRWKTKSIFMAAISLGFAKNRTRGIFDLLRQDGVSGPKAWFGFAHYMLLGAAPFRRTLVPWFQFFMPGFHPWNIDDRALVQLAESEYEAAVMPENGETVAVIPASARKSKLAKVA